MPDMFFPDEDELMRQAMYNQEATQYSSPVAPMQPSVVQPGVASYKSGESIADSGMLKNILAQMSSPLASQVKSSPPPVDDLSAKYAGQLKAIQDQMGMNEVTPERRAEINKGLRWQAMFADMNRNITGQPSEQLALSKELAAQELNPGKDQFERMNRSLELLKNLKGMESSKHDDTLKQAMIAEQIKAIQDKRDMSDPNSVLSASTRPATRSNIESYASILDAFGNKGKGKSQIPGLLETSNQITKIADSVDKASANQQKDLVDNVRDLVARSTGLRNTELERMAVSINAGRLGETKRENLEKDADRDAKTKLAGQRLQHSIANMKLDTGANKALKEMDNIYNTVKGLDEIDDMVNENHTGLMKQIEMAIKKPFGEMSGEERKLIAKIALVYQPYRKQQFGVPSAGDEKIVVQYYPQIKENPESFRAALQEFKTQRNRELASQLGSFVATHTADLGISPDDIDESNAFRMFKPFKGNLSKATKSQEVEKIDPAKVMDEQKTAKPSVSKAKLDAYAKQYGLSADDAAKSLKGKGFNVEGY